MKIKNNLIYSFIFTLILVTFIIWNRLIRERLPRKVDYHETYNCYDKIIIIIFCLYLSLFVYYLLTCLKVLPRPQSKIKAFLIQNFIILEKKVFIQKILEFNKNIIIDGPANVYDFFYQFIYVKPFIWFCGKKLSYYFQEKPFLPYFIGFLLPKLIIVLVLFIEIMFFNEINYFYKTLILYLIPLIFKIILYIIEHHSKDSLDLLDEFFTFQMLRNFNTFEITNRVFTDPIKLQQQQNMLYYAEKDWLPLQYMYSITAKINIQKDKYNNITNAIIYGLFSLSFLINLLKTTGFL